MQEPYQTRAYQESKGMQAPDRFLNLTYLSPSSKQSSTPSPVFPAEVLKDHGISGDHHPGAAVVGQGGGLAAGTLPQALARLGASSTSALSPSDAYAVAMAGFDPARLLLLLPSSPGPQPVATAKKVAKLKKCATDGGLEFLDHGVQQRHVAVAGPLALAAAAISAASTSTPIGCGQEGPRQHHPPGLGAISTTPASGAEAVPKVEVSSPLRRIFF